MHELAPLIYDLAIILGLAGLVALICQRIKQPVVLGYLAAGMIVGPYTPPYALVNDIPNIQILSELGVIFLMFSLGLEFSFQKLTRVGFSASITGLVEVLLMVILGYGAGYLMGWTHYDCLFLGAALAISSTTIIIKAIDDLRLKTKLFAEVIFGVLIIEDLLAILLLVALSTLVMTHSFLSMDMFYASMKLLLVVGGWFLAGYFMVPPIFRYIARYLSEETLIILSVGLCLGLVCAAASLHYSTALGAFIMGSILAETNFVHRIEHLVKPIRDVFAAVFFVSVGMLINPQMMLSHWGIILFISLITIFGKVISTGMGALLTGQSLNTSVRVGFGMAQIGELSFIIAALGVSLKVTSDKLYPIIVAVSGITTFTTPYLIRFSGYVGESLDKWLPERTRYFLENYSAWVYRAQSGSHGNPLVSRATIRLLINGIITAIIFILVDQYLMPKLHLPQLWLENTLGLIIALLLSSPFIWGMLFFFKLTDMPEYAKTRLNPVVFMVWLLTLAEVTILSLVYFYSSITTVLFLLIAFLFFVFAFRRLEKSYRWFEQSLVTNISGNGHSKRYAELAPWETHLVEIQVGDKSILNNKTLVESGVRQEFGVNIVAIAHGSRVLTAPRGHERIVAGDKLIVLGTDKQIDAFKEKVETVVEEYKEEQNFLDNFILKAILLSEGHPWIGKTIRGSGIREAVKGMVVGLERDHSRILNPTPDTMLQVDDLLLVVGDVDAVYKL